MTYKEFVEWCNQRAADGLWDKDTAFDCISALDLIQSHPFWRRKKIWKRFFVDEGFVEDIIEPVNHKINKMLKED